MSFITTTADMVETGVLLAMFIIVFLVCLRVLPMMQIQGLSRIVMAVCVAALCILGMMNLLAPPHARTESETHSITLMFILIPYTALGLTLVLMVILLLVMRWLPDDIKKRASIMLGQERQRGRGQRRGGK